jgi:hypothetical protein
VQTDLELVRSPQGGCLCLAVIAVQLHSQSLHFSLCALLLCVAIDCLLHRVCARRV